MCLVFTLYRIINIPPSHFQSALSTLCAIYHYMYRDPCVVPLTEETDAAPEVTEQASATFSVDMTSLYVTLCETLRDDDTTLLLYLMLHRNLNMKAFLLSRTNIDQLVSSNASSVKLYCEQLNYLCPLNSANFVIGPKHDIEIMSLFVF